MNIISIITIFLISVSPLPALPIIIYTYSQLGFSDGFISIIIASNIATIAQYSIGYYMSGNKYLQNLSYKKLSPIISIRELSHNQISFEDLILLRFSNLFITKIINIFLGMNRYSLNKVLIINNISFIPWQILYFYLSTNIDLISEYLVKYGYTISSVDLFSSISIACLFILIMKIIKFSIKRKFNFYFIRRLLNKLNK